MSAKTIYKTLAPFFDAVDGTEEKALKFTAPGYMDLCIEALGYNDHEGRRCIPWPTMGSRTATLCGTRM